MLGRSSGARSAAAAATRVATDNSQAAAEAAMVVMVGASSGGGREVGGGQGRDASAEQACRMNHTGGRVEHACRMNHTGGRVEQACRMNHTGGRVEQACRMNHTGGRVEQASSTRGGDGRDALDGRAWTGQRGMQDYPTPPSTEFRQVDVDCWRLRLTGCEEKLNLELRFRTHTAGVASWLERLVGARIH